MNVDVEDEVEGAQLEGAARERYVKDLFDRIAGPYDRLNRLISLGRDPAWRKYALDRIGVGPGMHALDLGTGTGDLFLLLRERVGATGHVTGIDLSDEMLDVARQKAGAVFPGEPHELRQGTASDTGTDEASQDVVTMGWVLRNVGDRQDVYREVLRVLKPGGHFVSLDMSRPKSAVLRAGAGAYMHLVMPVATKLFGGDMAAYKYLAQSTDRFPDKNALAEEWRAAGFVDVAVSSRMMGSIAIHFGRKLDGDSSPTHDTP